MTKVVSINPLSSSSIEDAIAQIEAIQYKLKKLEEFNSYLKSLADAGVAIAQNYFDQGYLYNTWGGDYGNVVVTSKMTENGFIVEASGKQVLFMEFGAGVYYNGTGSYPEELPTGITHIGGYGKHNGLKQAWGYYQDNETKAGLTITRGVPSLQAMYKSKKYIVREVERRVKELLKND